MKIVRTSQEQWQQAIEHGKFSGKRKDLGGERLRSGLWELPPGKRSFPMHMHHVTEEAMFVLSGHGKVRTPDGEYEIGQGDYVSFPPGGKAHQLVNDGNEPMIYVAMSATLGHDIVEYPESDKVACAVGVPPHGKRFVFKKKDQAEYFAGED